ncbi:uncharacterized protein LOC143288042 [Babylonia areolata]|uniref:uncharacterized protein LOC143288039 n=1 Tax=Babylonia areolata TaxID=304850 RepID=UPI003FD257CF
MVLEGLGTLLPGWRAVGLAENLTSNFEIAKFLVADYLRRMETREQGECYYVTELTCEQCHSMLSLHCASCNTVPSVTLSIGYLAGQTLQPHLADSDTLAQGPAQEEGLLLQQEERLLVHGGGPPEEAKPSVEGEAPQQGPLSQAAFVEERDLLLPGTQESRQLQEDLLQHLSSLRHTPEAVFVPEDPVLPHPGFLGGTEAVAEDPQLHPTPSFQLVPQVGSLPQTPTLVLQAVHLAVPQQQDLPVQQQAAASAEQTSACAASHPQSLENAWAMTGRERRRKRLEVSLERCDALIQKNGRAVGERRAVIRRQEHTDTEGGGYHRRHRNKKLLSCNRSFRTNSQLNKHRQSRHGEMQHPFRCNRCGQCFVKAQTLKHHMYSHTGERPFKCPQCPSTFTRRDYLNKHMTTHTGEKRFQCDVCSKKFAFVSSLNSHKKQKHGAKKKQNAQTEE